MFIPSKTNKIIWSLLAMRIIRLSLSLSLSFLSFSLSLSLSLSDNSHPCHSRESAKNKDMVPWSQLLMWCWALAMENLLLNYSPGFKVLSDWCGMTGRWQDWIEGLLGLQADTPNETVPFMLMKQDYNRMGRWRLMQQHLQRTIDILS